MNRLPPEKRAEIVRCLVNGESIRGTARMCGCAKNTVAKLLGEIGEACRWYHDRIVDNIECTRVECDEIWSFTYSDPNKGGTAKSNLIEAGDIWTWVALCSESKLIVSYLVGPRDGGYAQAFVQDVASRLTNCVRLTVDGHTANLEAVEGGSGSKIDYGKLVNVYGDAPESFKDPQRLSERTNSHELRSKDQPTNADVSTSYLDRQNLTLRMHMQRSITPANALSRKIESHDQAIALHIMYYNFCHIHRLMKNTPAINAGISSTFWEVEDIVKLAGEYWLEKSLPNKRGSHKRAAQT